MENSVDSKLKNSFSIENILAKPISQHTDSSDFINNHISDTNLFKNKISDCDEDYCLGKKFSIPDSSCIEDTNELCSDEASEGSNCEFFINLKLN